MPSSTSRASSCGRIGFVRHGRDSRRRWCRARSFSMRIGIVRPAPPRDIAGIAQRRCVSGARLCAAQLLPAACHWRSHFARQEDRSGRNRIRPLVLDLMGLQVQVGAICPEPRLRPGTAPDEYIKAPGHRNLTREAVPSAANLGVREPRGNVFQPLRGASSRASAAALSASSARQIQRVAFSAAPASASARPGVQLGRQRRDARRRSAAPPSAACAASPTWPTEPSTSRALSSTWAASSLADASSSPSSQAMV